MTDTKTRIKNDIEILENDIAEIETNDGLFDDEKNIELVRIFKEFLEDIKLYLS